MISFRFGRFNKSPEPTYPSPETWEHASPRQVQRAARSFAILAAKGVPAYPAPLMVSDDEQVVPQRARAVVLRSFVLWNVVVRADGVPQREVLDLIEQQGLWDFVSPSEKVFFETESPDPDECRRLVWRLESIWTLLWALGCTDQLDWPNKQCDVDQLADLLHDPQLLNRTELRPLAEILDAQDLTLRIHWAVHDALLRHDAMIPEDLDWSRSSRRVPLADCGAVGVVEERHYALNWVLNVMDSPDWDGVDTST